MNDSSTYYRIAFHLIEGLGNVTSRRLIQHFGGVREVFDARLDEINGVIKLPKRIYEQLHSPELLAAAESEMQFIHDNGIETIWFEDEEYPKRLRQAYDAPILLYKKGDFDLNRGKVVAIVGTRSCTRYGIEKTREFVEGLLPHNALIISGLAYGIDITAHRHAMDNQMTTVGVLGHGLNKIYPAAHRSDADQMCENGGLLTEFPTNVKLVPELFPMRNRIVAALADATIVVEAAAKGGALITAQFAFGYNRDVFALPGRVGDRYSEGCNNLIKQQKAHLLQSVKDIEYIMRWDAMETERTVQKQLFVELTSEEQELYDYLENQKTVGMETLMVDLGLPGSILASRLLQMELKGIVRAYPGKKYSLA